MNPSSEAETAPKLGVRTLARRIVRRIRRMNRVWLDWLDPDAEVTWAPVEEPAPRTQVPVVPAVSRQALVVKREETPNPDAMKFVCNRRLVEAGSISFSNARAAEGHPLGRTLFQVDGVKSIFAINDFVSVTRQPNADWDRIGPQVEHQLQMHFTGI